MRKFDLHIHTVATPSDAPFTFDMGKLLDYIKKTQLDCIAITNHNCFDLNQYNSIVQTVKIAVFPGIEINFENGHLILISSNNEMLDFNQKCKQVAEKIKSVNDYITISQLKQIFVNLDQYLIIPHYDKNPDIREDILNQIKEYINAGEVNSVKKFKGCIKDPARLTPVLFSDIRISDQLTEFPNRSTYFDIGDITISSIKNALSDKNKISLSKDNGHKLFQVLDDGLEISTGLTVVLGERSSGKTYTLDNISRNYPNAKYIKQFSLLSTDDETDQRKFDEMLSNKQSSVSEEFLSEFKGIVNEMQNVDFQQDMQNLNQYLTSLIQYATEVDRADIFSKSAIYTETEYESMDLNVLKSVISSVEKLIETTEYRMIIDKYISLDSLKKLIVELMRRYASEQETNLQKLWVNELLEIIKNDLKIKSSSISIPEVNFYKILLDAQKISKFNIIAKSVAKERVVYSKCLSKFKIEASIRAFISPGEMKNFSKRVIAFSDAFKSYDSPYNFLQKLKEIGQLAATEYYKYFAIIEYKVLNEFGYKVSGGERSEFNLLNEINDANQYDMLLLDEPESSFDNLFLKSSVNKILKDISCKMPVVVVTHNNTVGASIKPDYILYTQKVINNTNLEYRVYFGYPTDKELIDLKRNKISNYDVLLNCLEAGNVAYDERRKEYETVKD